LAKLSLDDVKVPGKESSTDPVIKVGKFEVGKDQVDKVTDKCKTGLSRIKNAAKAAGRELVGEKEEETKEPFIKIGRFKIG
jgi:tRNA(Phe) wybutosine-synthesizing methylase Tyw3